MTKIQKVKMKKQSNLAYFACSFLVLLFVDVYFSKLITYKLLHGFKFSTPILRILYAENTGAAFSILQNSRLFLIGLSIIALIFIAYFVIKNIQNISKLDLLLISFLSAGISGNLYERIFIGYVRDFFDLAFIKFPIFNISDVFINIGIFGIIVLILLNKKPFKL